MTRQIISTDKAPKAIGPYSQAVAAETETPFNKPIKM